MRKRLERLVTARQICYPLAVIMLDRILHDADHPICADPTCSCREQDTAPYLDCPCSSCEHVRSVLSEWQSWNSQVMQQSR